jgi:RNA polymerase sigma factor (sigma-70 family)
MTTINRNETYTNISPKLLGICRRYIKDIATAEDIVQDSFIIAIQKENTLKNTKAINGWLSRIVINMAIHHLKETKKINFSTSDDFDLVDNSTLMNTLELDNKSALLASDIDQSDILEAIDRLPEHHKSVFNMYVMDNFSHNEIAQTLAISVGTSKSNLSRARKAIQNYLFEKLKDKTVDKKKKRRLAFLLFFGLENKIFARYYQSKFKDFEIVTKKSFSFAPKKVAVPHQFVGLKKAVALSNITVFSIGFIGLTGLGFYIVTPDLNTKNSTEKQNKITIENKQENSTNSSIVTKIDSLKKESRPQKTVAEKVVSNKLISTKKDDNTIQQPVAQKNKKTITPTLKDSVQAEKPKVVVVKKQIIKRDTIYVAK